MALPDLPTVWNVYNLRGSPFFQDTLSVTHERRNLELFVGRGKELKDLLDYMRGRDSSRQAIGGVSGVGKTTLVQMLKAQAVADGYITTDSLVPFVANDTPEALFGRVLGTVYETILANRPQAGGNPAMQDAQQMVRAARLATGGGSLSAAGFGASMTKGVTLTTPKDILIDGPRVLRDLFAMLRGTGEIRGLVLHMNNLESLGTKDLEGAGNLLMSLRDPMLMHDGLHVVVVGTTDAVSAVVGAQAQVRSVFRVPMLLEPLALADVHALLQVRYEHWRARPHAPAQPPVAADAVDRLFEVFQGDLRGLLKALDDGVEECIGLLPTAVGAVTVPPVSLTELATALQARYHAIMESELEPQRLQQLGKWLKANPAGGYAQRELIGLWGVSQGAVSTALTILGSAGYVTATPRQGNAPTTYSLSGKARVIAGLTVAA